MDKDQCVAWKNQKSKRMEKNWLITVELRLERQKKTLKRIDNGKFVPIGNPAEVWKCVGRILLGSLSYLTEF